MKKKWLKQFPVCQECGRGWDAVTHAAKGLCRGCSRKQQYIDNSGDKNRSKWSEEFTCCQNVNCPNTKDGVTQVVHQAQGLCKSCYSKKHRDDNLDHYHGVEELRRMKPEVVKYMRDYMDTYYPANKQKWVESGQKRRQEKPEACRAEWARYRENNREICRASFIKWYHVNEENKLQSLETARQWRQEHPEEARQLNRNRRAKLAGLEGNFTVEEWLQVCENHEFKCYHCGKGVDDGILLTPDHLVPVDSGDIVPTNDIDNIGPLCGPCNSSKRNKSLAEFDPTYLERQATRLTQEGKEGHCVVQLWNKIR